MITILTGLVCLMAGTIIGYFFKPLIDASLAKLFKQNS